MDTKSVLMVDRWEEVWENGWRGEEVRGLRSKNWYSRKSHGNVKYSTGNGVAEELTCMTHGHEQRWWTAWGEWGQLGGKGQREKNWDSCNSTIIQHFLKIDWLIDWFIGRGEGRKRGRETSMCGCLLHAPYRGPGPQPRRVPSLGIEPVIFWFTGQRSTHWATPARAK